MLRYSAWLSLRDIFFSDSTRYPLINKQPDDAMTTSPFAAGWMHCCAF
ncbi:hypothetical protein WKH24_13325 [Pantoea agglomerans]